MLNWKPVSVELREVRDIGYTRPAHLLVEDAICHLQFVQGISGCTYWVQPPGYVDQRIARLREFLDA